MNPSPCHEELRLCGDRHPRELFVTHRPLGLVLSTRDWHVVLRAQPAPDVLRTNRAILCIFTVTLGVLPARDHPLPWQAPPRRAPESAPRSVLSSTFLNPFVTLNANVGSPSARS